MSNANPRGDSEAEWLRQNRHKRSLHQHQLAARIDVNQGRISEWEHGKPIPRESLERLIRVFNN